MRILLSLIHLCFLSFAIFVHCSLVVSRRYRSLFTDHCSLKMLTVHSQTEDTSNA